jgi:hypothetical protein
LLAGASCRPVYSDQPVGGLPVALPNEQLAMDGIWCSRQQKKLCWSIEAADPKNGIVVLDPVRVGADAAERVRLHVRHAVTPKARAEELGFLVLSEEDAVLKGTYLWALAIPVDSSMLLVWFPFPQIDAFADMVKRGELPGRIVAPVAGRTAFFGEKTEQTVILEGLTDEHLQLIVDRRGQLFDLSMTFVYERVWPR